ncbi:molecular chaperone GrpE [Paenibacillus sp. FSL R5-0345]|uniref:nucleotide exchange factor GrpE n=1 Tax=unclassified Paenibacillus TaxID=185978 RepID=UPI0004F675FF|nr:nucleotide exchange factor GrpE [Paenibacillus sp. FSL R5-0345]AIQ37348.1 molecular chaperone GrpE [Paenibacillus sp. FSL R5-0345]
MKKEQVQDANEFKDDLINEEPEADAASKADSFTAEEVSEGASDTGTEVKRLQDLADEYQGRALRAQADFDNFRRRTQKEKEELAQYATSKLVTELLSVLDNFERALVTTPSGPESEAFVKGVNMIFRQLDGVLKSEGLTAMETVGQPFNPEYHQAIMQVESEEYEEGIVTEEVQKGYLLKDKVLRPAMVKVSM